MIRNCFVAFLLCCSVYTQAQYKKYTFEIKEGKFLVDGKSVQIHSGEMHYARVPKEYWRHRLKMLKAMGLNTVATYVFWNYHNTSPGKWDFTSGNKNLAEFIRTAKEEGLFVILRPGPYACAEWDFGGYPWWLQKNKDLTIRSNNKPFLDSCRIYLMKLAEQVKSLQATIGGPVIMVQVENEFGSYVSQRKDISMEDHRKYISAIKEILTEAGIDVPLFTSDGSWLFDGGSVSDVLPTANGEGSIENLKKAVDKYHSNQGPYMVAEFYPGWLDHWGEPFSLINTNEVVRQTEKYLQNSVHFNFYMVHGGTNFGFTSGANYNDEHDIQPDLTSYDYDAPISEAGWVTPKYLALRDLMKKYVSYSVPEIPEKLPVLDSREINLTVAVDLFNCKNTIYPVVNSTPLSFEDLNQGQGYVLYSKKFTQPVQGTVMVPGLRDYGIVYVDGKKVGELNRQENKYGIDVVIPFDGRLDILVENLGRINYGSLISENGKGIISPITINGYEITGDWKMYRLPFENVPDISKSISSSRSGLPVIYYGVFNTDKIGDMFLDLQDWGKGIVFVNGHNLGRYWKVGPQHTLYLPGCWLEKEENEVIIFEQQNDIPHKILKTRTTPVLNEVVK